MNRTLNQKKEKTTPLRNQSLRSSGDTWRELGYVNTPTGTLVANGGTAPGGGPVEFIEIFEPSPNNVLAGSNSGGLFQSTFGGTSWKNIGSDEEWLDSGCTWAEYHPSNPNIIFAISNNGHNESSWIGYTGGVMRTLDGGTSWEQIGDQSNLIGFIINLSKLRLIQSIPMKYFWLLVMVYLKQTMLLNLILL